MPPIDAFDVSSPRHSAWTQIAHMFAKSKQSLNNPAPPTQKLHSNYAKDPKTKRVRVTTRYTHALFSCKIAEGN